VDQNDDASRTALHLAAEAGSAKAVVMLIDAGASATRPSKDGRTPLHLLALSGVNHPGAAEIVRQLHSKHADLNARDENGNTPAMVALRRNNLPVLQALFEAGASLHLTNGHSQNTLHFAARYANTNVLGYLSSLRLEGINPELPSKSEATPKDDLCWAMQAEDSELIPPLRRPCPATRAAFTQLFFGVVYRNLISDLTTLCELHQSVKQSDWATSCIKLSTLISWKDTCYQHQDASRYRGILNLVEEACWSQAMEHIQIDVQDTICGLKFAQGVLRGHVNPFSGDSVKSEEAGEDLECQSQWESCLSEHDKPDEPQDDSPIPDRGIVHDDGSNEDGHPDPQEQEKTRQFVPTMGKIKTCQVA
jgi:hypothetical protein